MTPLQKFKALMQDRRAWPRNSLEWLYRTDAARKYYWLHVRKPTCEWGDA